MAGALLTARELTKTFPSADGGPAVTVLRGVSLDVLPGELVAIVGPSGSGKSTLLYCLSGLEPPTTGEVELLGRPLSELGRRGLAQLRRGHVGFVFQSYNLIPSLTAAENVSLPLRLAGRRGAAVAGDVAAALAAVGLTDRARHRPVALSGGQQQRVALARVLAARPELVFADEPTGALDTAAGAQVLALLRGAAREGRAVVMVTHDVSAAALADRVLVLRDGAVHQHLTQPSADQVFAAVADTAPVV